MIEALANAVATDPIKALLGSGGVLGAIVLAIRWWRGRPRVVAQRVSEHFSPKVSPTVDLALTVELENLGRESTSLIPKARITCLGPNPKDTLEAELSLQGDQRTLSPVTPLIFTFEARLPAVYPFTHFRVITFRFSRGLAAKLRILNASGDTASVLRFAALKYLFKFFGALPHVKG